jgi:hypothetical protein
MPAARRLYWLPGALVVVGAVAVFVGTVFLPWVVGFVTRGLTGESAAYASLALFGVSIVGGILGLRMLARRPSAALASVAILCALFTGCIVVLGYHAYSGRVERMTSSGWNVAVGPGPYVAGVGVILWIIGALVGFARRRPAVASLVASRPMQPLGPPTDPPTAPAT